ncbi:hypothetical protein ACO2E2_04855 [Staphylococcus epidermidis]
MDDELTDDGVERVKEAGLHTLKVILHIQ